MRRVRTRAGLLAAGLIATSLLAVSWPWTPEAWAREPRGESVAPAPGVWRVETWRHKVQIVSRATEATYRIHARKNSIKWPIDVEVKLEPGPVKKVQLFPDSSIDVEATGIWLVLPEDESGVVEGTYEIVSEF